jgi:hypothetical protein
MFIIPARVKIHYKIGFQSNLMLFFEQSGNAIFAI